ncbi:hypothetical protein PHMEG_0001896 [Phytophthora megakarya]|uniref:Uncharacterized protein n=1 Tax=Phytophthora megakarya TaxID=4795 RepID=A0A225X0F7_9STRA|nr:hypothetical protein PHMEG_0001896 [Phytophthora megakarya]
MWDQTPRSLLGDVHDGVSLRPGTGRPMTSGSQRPMSRDSTISVSSITAMLESSMVHRSLNLDEIDAIKEDLREALNEERGLLLEDIDFIQGCLEMEKDLIDDDRRKVTSAKAPPSLNDLHDLRKTLEKTLEDQVQFITRLSSWQTQRTEFIHCTSGGCKKDGEHTQQSERHEFICPEPNVR